MLTFNFSYNGYWYQLSFRSQKLLLMIMKRSSKSCTFTAGKVYTFSMQNFAMVRKFKSFEKIDLLHSLIILNPFPDPANFNVILYSIVIGTMMDSSSEI